MQSIADEYRAPFKRAYWSDRSGTIPVRFCPDFDNTCQNDTKACALYDQAEPCGRLVTYFSRILTRQIIM